MGARFAHTVIPSRGLSEAKAVVSRDLCSGGTGLQAGAKIPRHDALTPFATSARDDDCHDVRGALDKQFYVYILASYTQRLYIGMTSDLEGRMWEHRTKAFPGHTAKYNIDRLVYVENYAHADDAIAREQQLKNWSRQKKIDLIVGDNSTWRDLAIDLFGWAPNEFRE